MPIYTPPLPIFTTFEPAQITANTASVTNGTMHFNAYNFNNYINATAFKYALAISNSSSAGASITHSIGAYSLINASSLSLISSATHTIGFNSTAANSSYTRVSGTRIFSGVGNFNIAPGRLWIAHGASIATSATSGTYNWILAQGNQTLNNQPYNLTNYTKFPLHGYLVTGSFPTTVHTSSLIQSSNVALRAPWFRFN